MNARGIHEHPSTWLTLRETPLPSDVDEVRRLAASSAFFRPDEIEVAVELVQEHLERGPESGYRFVFAEDVREAHRLVGYTCYGEIACTQGSYDLYWIVTDHGHRGRGIGSWLLRETEARVRDSGGRRIFIETSGTEIYRPTRHFYLGCGYALEGMLADFYQPGDSKLVYGKTLVPRGLGR